MFIALLLQVAAPMTDPALPVTPTALEARAGEVTGPAAAQAWARAALAWLDAGDGARARTAFDRALDPALSGDLRPADNAELRLGRARADALIGDMAAARADLDAAIRLAPGDTVPLLLSASLARRTGDLQRASDDLEAAWDLAPDDPLVLLEAAKVARASGEPEQASVAWRRVLAIDADPAAKAEAAAGLTALGLKVE